MITVDTITDDQIRALRAESSEDGSGVVLGEEFYSAAVMLNVCDEALDDFDYGDTFAALPMAEALRLVDERRVWARSFCARILNSRSSK